MQNQPDVYPEDGDTVNHYNVWNRHYTVEYINTLPPFDFYICHLEAYLLIMFSLMLHLSGCKLYCDDIEIRC